MPPEGVPNGTQADAGVVLLAAGGSTRMGGDKMLLELTGRPVLEYSLETFQRSDRVRAIVIVASDVNGEAISDLVSSSDYDKVSAVVTGGARRQDSTANGVDQLMGEHGSGIKFVLVHDGARPFVDEAMIERGLMAAAEHGAAVPALPVSDTIKSVKGDGTVEQTLVRSRLRAIQTPQVFRVDVLTPALRPTEDVTDDAALVELAGGSVGLFDGHPDNIKLTTPEDIDRATAILARRNVGGTGATNRWGTGFDGHALVSGGPLRLGGVNIDHDRHLEGHSDGDVLLHAIASAVLGAAGLGDLGSNFPSSDPTYAGIDSRELLQRAASMAGDAGWEVCYLDATIIAQQPKLAPYVNRIKDSIAETLSIPVDSVNIKITSTDHVGAIGAGEGIAAQAIATLSIKPIS
jgi:2-C-methyl-D-erythritol 4-phosphate cytidylyltransferase/2-C-methyl-D-erythritol 2,4-cyclodiphosphate synthase